jgi:hypothetical protein
MLESKRNPINCRRTGEQTELRLRELSMNNLLRVALLFLLIFSVSGCTKTVSYHVRKPQDISTRVKFDKRLWLSVDPSLRKRSDVQRPIDVPGATSIRFNVGAALTENLVAALSAAFSSVQLMPAQPTPMAANDCLLMVSLREVHYDVGTTVTSQHNIQVSVQYILFDSKGTQTLAVVGDGRATRGLQGQGTIIASAGGYYEAIGLAFDAAIYDSIDQFLTGLSQLRFPSPVAAVASVPSA